MLADMLADLEQGTAAAFIRGIGVLLIIVLLISSLFRFEHSASDSGIILHAMPSDYLPLLILFVIAAVIAAVMVGGSWLLGPKRPTPAKESPYECGTTPVGSARERFPIHFYLTKTHPHAGESFEGLTGTAPVSGR